MHESDHDGGLLGGSLLVAGTCIGAGMLALPVTTSPAGFGPSIFIYLICWFLMAGTGLLMSEVALSMPGEPNLVSMAERTLGRWGKVTCWILYLFLFYCLTIAYVTECGNMLTDVVDNQVPEWMGTLIFVLATAPILYRGTHTVDRMNELFMLGLIITYVGFVVLGAKYVQSERLMTRDWSFVPQALPIVFVSFAFQGIVPTIVTYENRNPRRIRRVILLGSFLPLVIYAVWQWLTLGVLPPEGPGSLQEAYQNGWSAVKPMRAILDSPMIYLLGRGFSFFALISSFFGVTLGLMDFLSDGMGVEKTSRGKLFLCSLIFVPPLLISWVNPHIFLSALELAGGIGCAVLLALFPVLMVWQLRYREKVKTPMQLGGGRALLLALGGLVIYQLFAQLGRVL